MSDRHSEHPALSKPTFWGALADLWPSLGKVYPYMAWGLFLGVACFGAGRIIIPSLTLAGLSSLLPIAQPFERLLHHLGVGFFVSATAVLLYEWGAHYKEVLAESHRLTNAVDVAHDAINRMAFAEILRNRFEPHRRGAEISQALTDAYKATEQLAAYQNWCSDAAIDCALAMFKSASDNALHLAVVNADIAAKRPSGQDYHLDLPEPGLTADVVLRDVIKAVGNGRYVVVSDIESWHVGLDKFLSAHGMAVAHGAKIQRLFKLPNPPSEHTIDVVTAHYSLAAKINASSDLGRYDVRFCDMGRFAELSDRFGRLSEAGHFGIFVPGTDDEFALRFQVAQSDLSRFTLTSISRNDQLIQEFDELWPILDDPTPAERAEFFLIQTIRGLGRSGSYYVISEFASWMDGGLAEFQAETLRAIRDRSIVVKRAFALKAGDDEAAAQAILLKHIRDSRSVSGYEGSYDVKLCRSGEASLAVDKQQWQFGVFRGGHAGDDTGEVLSETAGDDMTGFRLKRLGDADRKRARNLRTFVDALPKAEDRALDLLKLDLKDMQ